ncbi:hypothetical protein RRG08_060298 [Elysia crispata]|uniref:Uncharacterized protein n=1 Tax=Elysia crispata TaxID=231223 RepID=A0AAE0Y2D5_9GAST|nr:hypothetical protein RRG08_060298 [Elysia crispata]
MIFFLDRGQVVYMGLSSRFLRDLGNGSEITSSNVRNILEISHRRSDVAAPSQTGATIFRWLLVHIQQTLYSVFGVSNYPKSDLGDGNIKEASVAGEIIQANHDGQAWCGRSDTPTTYLDTDLELQGFKKIQRNTELHPCRSMPTQPQLQVAVI